VSERLPEAIRRLVPDVTRESDPPTVASFLRGLAVGALVGAAIAGSALLQRRRQHAGGDRAPNSPADQPGTELH
jgi:hypothetical protein